MLGLPVTFRDERLTSHLAEAAPRPDEARPLRRTAEPHPARRLPRPRRSRGRRDHPAGRARRSAERAERAGERPTAATWRHADDHPLRRTAPRHPPGAPARPRTAATSAGSPTTAGPPRGLRHVGSGGGGAATATAGRGGRRRIRRHPPVPRLRRSSSRRSCSSCLVTALRPLVQRRRRRLGLGQPGRARASPFVADIVREDLGRRADRARLDRHRAGRVHGRAPARRPRRSPTASRRRASSRDRRAFVFIAVERELDRTAPDRATSSCAAR